MAELTLHLDTSGDSEVPTLLDRNLRTFNEAKIGSYSLTPVTIFLRNQENQVIAGMHGDIFGQLCRIMTVWVHEAYRYQKLGSQLFEKLEEFCKQQGCNLIQLDTAEFQARGFYEKIGFQVVATLPNNFMGYTTYILRKSVS